MPSGSPATIIGLAAAFAAVTALVALLVTVRRARRARAEVERRLSGSHREVQRLAEQVSALTEEVRAARRSPVDGREYVITTLAEVTQATGASDPRAPDVSLASVAEGLEEQAVTRLGRVDTSTRLGARLAGVGVKALALGHGLRCALTQDNLDRASAEALVARRRSRRTRRQELREARRLIRAVRAQQRDQRAPTGSHESEDVA